MFEVKKLTIKNRNIEKLKEKHGWKGSGQINDPIIIDSVEGLPNILKFKNINKHFTIKNVKINQVDLKRCENFQIENCVVCACNLDVCRHNTMRNNIFGSFSLKNSKENIIQSNNIRSNSLTRLKNEDSNKGLNTALIILSLLGPIFWIALILVLIFDFKYLLALNFPLWNFVVFLSCISFIFIYYIIDTARIKIFLSKNSSNTILDNKSVTDEFLQEKLCRNCLYQKECIIFRSITNAFQSDTFNQNSFTLDFSTSFSQDTLLNSSFSPQLSAKKKYSVKFPYDDFIYTIIFSCLIVVFLIPIFFILLINLVSQYHPLTLFLEVIMGIFIIIGVIVIHSFIKKFKFYRKAKKISNP